MVRGKRVGRSGFPTQNFLRRASRGGSVGRTDRVGNALHTAKRVGVEIDARKEINFAPPSRIWCGESAKVGGTPSERRDYGRRNMINRTEHAGCVAVAGHAHRTCGRLAVDRARAGARRPPTWPESETPPIGGALMHSGKMLGNGTVFHEQCSGMRQRIDLEPTV